MLSLIHVLEWRAAVSPDLNHCAALAAAAAAPLGARERLAGFKCPAGVTVVPALPRNATGKVMRAALRAPFWAGRDRRVC